MIATGFVFVFLLASLHDAQGWGDDFAQYIAHARNLMRGTPYAEFGHLYGVGAYLGPREYPPLFPLTLVPIYAWKGIDWWWLKVPGVVAMCASLAVWGFALRGLVGAPAAAAWIVLMGLHPTLRNLTDSLLSDPLFALTVACSLLAMDRWIAAPSTSAESSRRGWVMGLLIGTSVLTRVAGLALVPIPLVLERLRTRATSRLSIIAVSTALFVAGAGALAFPGTRTYADEPGPPLRARAARWTQLYAADFTGFLPGIGEARARGLLDRARQLAGAPPRPEAHPDAAGLMAAAATCGWLALCGIGLLSQREVRSHDLFFAASFAGMLWHAAYVGERVAASLLPVIYLYLTLGLAAVARRFGRAILPMGIGAAIVANLAFTEPRPASPGVESEAATRFVEFVRSSTPKDAVIVFAKPRALAVLADRRSVAVGIATDQETDRVLRTAGATHLVTSPIGGDDLDLYVQRHAAAWRRVYDGDGFRVYAAVTP